jgi:hypothetical protein
MKRKYILIIYNLPINIPINKIRKKNQLYELFVELRC